MITRRWTSRSSEAMSIAMIKQRPLPVHIGHGASRHPSRACGLHRSMAAAKKSEISEYWILV